MLDGKEAVLINLMKRRIRNLGLLVTPPDTNVDPETESQRLLSDPVEQVCEELTGTLLVVEGALLESKEAEAKADALIAEMYADAMAMTGEEVASLDEASRQRLHMLVCDQLCASRHFAGEWYVCDDDWIVVVGPSDNPQSVARGKADTWPNDVELSELSKANDGKSVWLIQRP